MPLLLLLACGDGADHTPPVRTNDDGLPDDADADADTDADTDADSDADSDADTDADSDADTDADTDTEPAPDTVTVGYTGTVVTVSGTPFGFDDSVRETAVSGSFTWDLAVPDSDDDAHRGEYDHGGTGAFTLSVGGRTVTGSGSPQVEVQDADPDVFRFVDGAEVLDEGAHVMKVDGVRDAEIGLWVSIVFSDGTALAGDDLPATLPAWDPDFPHTFSVTDAGGTLLLQLTTLAP